MMMIFKRFVAIGLLVGLILGVGCSLAPVVDQTRYYLLGTEEGIGGSFGNDGGASVTIVELSVVRYLDSPEIAIREGGNRLRYLSNDRWAELPEYGLLRLLTERLLREESILSVDVAPTRRRSKADYDLSIKVRRLEGELGEEGYRARFEATWELIRTGSDVVVDSGRVARDRAIGLERNIGRLVEELSLGVDELARVIVEAIER